MSETKTRRPTDRDPEVANVAAAALWPEVKEWLGDDAPDDPAEVEHCKSTLASAIRKGGDGYEMARALELDGWACDSDLVEILDGAVFKINRAERAAVRAWVAAGNVVADLPAGTKVRHRHLEGHIGTIADHYEAELDLDPKKYKKYDHRAEGKYLVICKALGHGVKRESCTTHGVYLNAEEVEVVIEPPANAQPTAEVQP